MAECRICGCTETDGCPSEGLGCAWVEPDLCDVCDAFIDQIALAVDLFTHASVASNEDARFTAAVNKALGEASGRLRQHYTAQQPLIEVPDAPLIQVVRG